MATRFFLVPAENGKTPLLGGISLGPKYVKWSHDLDPQNAIIVDDPIAYVGYGLQPVFLIAADVTAPQLTAMQDLVDPAVTIVPPNLDNNVGATNLATVKAKIEALGIPADQITAQTDYRHIIRGITAIFALSQAFQRTGGDLLPLGLSLDTPLGNLSQDFLAKLQAASDELGYDRSGLTLQSTIRQLLNALASQQTPQNILGVVI
jgi:hypothetical protein